jgi:hypothetical protein
VAHPFLRCCVRGPWGGPAEALGVQRASTATREASPGAVAPCPTPAGRATSEEAPWRSGTARDTCQTYRPAGNPRHRRGCLTRSALAAWSADSWRRGLVSDSTCPRLGVPERGRAVEVAASQRGKTRGSRSNNGENRVRARWHGSPPSPGPLRWTRSSPGRGTGIHRGGEQRRMPTPLT